MLEKVSKYISSKVLLDRSRLHLVTLSGGADSVFLLLAMQELGYKIHAVHCNFRLRGDESDRDENFCRQLCLERNVPFHVTHFDTRTYAQVHKVSIEMAARELRYEYFEQLREAVGADDILVAHHRDDNVETVLMNLLRGTGIHGLEGIKPRNGRIVRPLLCLSRKEIERFLDMRGQEYVTDSSNLIDDVTRNKIRLSLIPLLETVNPAAVANIVRTINNVSEAVKVVDAAVANSVKHCLIKSNDGADYFYMSELMSQPSPEQTLFAILSVYNFSPKQIGQIYENINVSSGRTWMSPTHILASDRGAFIIDSIDSLNGPVIKIPETGTYVNAGVHFCLYVKEREDDFVPSKDKWSVTVDADKVRFPVTLRRVRQGDRFIPYGMCGTKLISDYLTDRKRNYFQRMRQMVLEDAEGNIVWLVGERVSHKVACDDNTIKILTLRYLENS